MNQKKKFLLITAISMILLSGCATPKVISLKESPPAESFYHKVRVGETLWQISKMHGVSVDEIVDANRIPNAAYIEENQLLLIPGVKPLARQISKVQALEDDVFQWPVRGKVISYFGDQKSLWVNQGINIRTSFGDPVYPARGGEVVFSDFLPGYGYTAIISHRDQYNTVYAQNSELLVKVGDFVTRDVPIAKVGGSDSLAFLHFEIRRDAHARNPLFYLP